MAQKWCVAFLNLYMRKRRKIQIFVGETLWSSDDHRFVFMNTVMNLLPEVPSVENI